MPRSVVDPMEIDQSVGAILRNTLNASVVGGRQQNIFTDSGIVADLRSDESSLLSGILINTLNTIIVSGRLQNIYIPVQA